MDSENNKCFDCNQSKQQIFKYNCGHKFCVDCTLIYAYERLRSFYSALDRNIDFFENKASFLGCKLQCNQAKLSLSLKYLTRFIEKSEVLNQSQKIEFRKFSEVGLSFFSGLKSFFSRCKTCGEIRSNIKEKILICRECISKICEAQCSSRPRGIYYEWQIDEADYDDRVSMFGSNQLYIVQQEGNSFKSEPIVYSNRLRVEKLTVVLEKCNAILMKAVVFNNEENATHFTMENDENTMQIIACLVLIK
jgi:hypothetical protein